MCTGTSAEPTATTWIIEPPSPQREQAAKRWNLPPIVAQLLLNRGHTLDASGAAFLAPSMADLHTPSLLPDVDKAVELLAKAIADGKKIALYGDYDVDGTTGVAILWHTLRTAGADVLFYVPHRTEEGYGLNPAAVRRLIKEGAGMVVTIDCGITAVEEADICRDAGVPLIITDHHAPQTQLPAADAIVHPSLTPQYPNPDLCGAGVAFKLSWALAQHLSGATKVTPTYRDLLVDLLPLAALGTIADVVPLVGENRIIARHGLDRLPATPWPGLQALMDSAGLRNGKVTGQDVGFKLAPRINAAGRMGHARLAVELLTRATPERAREIAIYLEEHNRTRRSTERKILKEAEEMIERYDLAGDGRRAIVLAQEGWHAGVIGIVAARLVDRHHRPTVMIALSGGEGQGSARSIRHFDLAEALAACETHLQGHGGHAMAAGVRIDEACVPAFAEAFVEVANNRLTGDDLRPKLRLDSEVALAELTMPTAEAIAALGPFGAGNPRPKLATGVVEVAAEPRCVGKTQDHLQVVLAENGVRIKGIGFRMAHLSEDLKQHRRCQVAFEPMINEFEGRRSVEMQLLDMRFPQ